MYKIKEWIKDISMYRLITGAVMILGGLFLLLRFIYLYYPIVGYCLGIFTLIYFGAELLGVFNKKFDWITRVFIWISGYVIVPFLCFLYHLGVADNSLVLFKWLLCIISFTWVVILMILIENRNNSRN